MRYLTAASLSAYLVLALAVLVLALAVSITTGGGGGDRLENRSVGLHIGPGPSPAGPGRLWANPNLGLADLENDVRRLLARPARPPEAPVLAASAVLGPSVPVIIAGPPGRIADLVVEAYDVKWARDILEAVEMCESSRQVQPCKRGEAGEYGPFQFMPSTWQSLEPFADLNPCNRATAWQAAAYFISLGRQLEWTCWPR